jgi:hypothetical protein
MRVQILSNSGKVVYECLYSSHFAFEENDPNLVRAVLTEAIWLSYQNHLIPPDQTCQVRGAGTS